MEWTFWSPGNLGAIRQYKSNHSNEAHRLHSSLTNNTGKFFGSISSKHRIYFCLSDSYSLKTKHIHNIKQNQAYALQPKAIVYMGNRNLSASPLIASITRVKNNHFKRKQDFQDRDPISVNKGATQGFRLECTPATSLLAASEQKKQQKNPNSLLHTNSILVKVCSTYLWKNTDFMDFQVLRKFMEKFFISLIPGSVTW